jgi:hypothetical protein
MTDSTIGEFTIHPDIPDAAEVRRAFEALEATDERRWGKMTAAQMTEHIARFNEIYLGRLKLGGFMGLMARLFGKFFVKRFLGVSPYEMKRGIGTIPAIRIEEPIDEEAFEAARTRILRTFEEIEARSGTWDHPLYGEIPAEVGRALARSHAAHHLRQFGRL